MNPAKVARVAAYDQAVIDWKKARMIAEVASRQAIGSGTVDGAGSREDWDRWQEAINNEMDLWIDLREAWEALHSEDPRMSH